MDYEFRIPPFNPLSRPLSQMDFDFNHLPQPCRFQLESYDRVRNRTLRISNLEDWMDEKYLMRCFYRTRQTTYMEVVRDPHSGKSQGYGIIECVNRAAARRILEAYDGIPMPKCGKNFRLSWDWPDDDDDEEFENPNQPSKEKLEFSKTSDKKIDEDYSDHDQNFLARKLAAAPAVRDIGIDGKCQLCFYSGV